MPGMIELTRKESCALTRIASFVEGRKAVNGKLRDLPSRHHLQKAQNDFIKSAARGLSPVRKKMFLKIVAEMTKYSAGEGLGDAPTAFVAKRYIDTQRSYEKVQHQIDRQSDDRVLRQYQRNPERLAAICRRLGYKVIPKRLK